MLQRLPIMLMKSGKLYILCIKQKKLLNKYVTI